MMINNIEKILWILMKDIKNLLSSMEKQKELCVKEAVTKAIDAGYKNLDDVAYFKTWG